MLVERNVGIAKVGIGEALESDRLAQVSDLIAQHRQRVNCDPTITGVWIGNGFDQFVRENRVGRIRRLAIWGRRKSLASGYVLVRFYTDQDMADVSKIDIPVVGAEEERSRIIRGIADLITWEAGVSPSRQEYVVLVTIARAYLRGRAVYDRHDLILCDLVGSERTGGRGYIDGC